MNKRIGYYLPEELVEDILLRLPPKSLTRFKCVCKSWNTLISDQKFIINHLEAGIKKTKNASSSSKVSLIMGWTRQELSLDDIFNFDDEYYDHELDRKQVLSLVDIFDKEDGAKTRGSDDDSNDQELVPSAFEDVYLPLLPKVELEDMGFLMSLFCSHCNGILCLVDPSPFYRERVAFYNPALREYRFLDTKSYLFDFDLQFDGYGFGYDSRANDYKYVRILGNTPSESKVEVYSLETDCWRGIEIDFDCFINVEGLYLKGFCYWVNCRTTILSFDMSEEKFYNHKLPAQLMKKMPHYDSLALWNESLVYFISWDYEWFSTSFEMWVMDNNNGGGGAEGFTWTKHLTIGPLLCIYSPVLFWNVDELLMDARDGRIVSYNLSTKKLRKLPIHGAMLPGTTYANLYVESLVSVKRKEEYFPVGEIH